MYHFDTSQFYFFLSNGEISFMASGRSTVNVLYVMRLPHRLAGLRVPFHEISPEEIGKAAYLFVGKVFVPERTDFHLDYLA